MELDPKLLQKIEELPDEVLRQSIAAIAEGMGVPAARTKPILKDMGKVKEAVTNLSEKDLVGIEKALGTEKSEELMQAIRREVEGK